MNRSSTNDKVDYGLSPSLGIKWEQGLTGVIYSHLVDPSVFLLNVLEELSHGGADGAEREQTLRVPGGEGHRHHGQTILIPQAQLYKHKTQ